MSDLISSCTLDTAPSEIGEDNTQWVHILPAGRVVGRDGRGPWTLAKPEEVLAGTRQYHGRNRMVVDYEHQSVLAVKNGRPNPAAGWIVGLEARKNGIWAKTEWTAQAAQMIRDKLYRYVSPVFSHDGRGTIKRILNVALTNTPNLEMTALASWEMTMETEFQQLRDLLGLGADADFEAIRAAIVSLRTSANSAGAVDPAKYVPIGDFTRAVAEANELRQGVSKQAAETHVDAQIRAGKLVPHLRDWAVSLCSVSVTQFDQFIEKTGPAFSKLVTESHARGPGPKKGSAGRLSEDQMAVCSAMGLTADEYTKALGAQIETD